MPLPISPRPRKPILESRSREHADQSMRTSYSVVSPCDEDVPYRLSVGVMLPLIAVLSAAWIDVDPVTCTIRAHHRNHSRELNENKSHLLCLVCTVHTYKSVPANQSSIIVFTSSMIFRRLLMGSIDEAGCGRRGDKVKTSF